MPTFENGARMGDVRAILNATGLRKNTYDADRAPGPMDDAASGYEIGSRWSYGPQFWTAASVTTGAAVWVASGAGGGGSAPVIDQTVFQTRTAAQSAVIPSAITRITVGGLAFQADPNGTALITAGGRAWSPLGFISPMHWGAAGDGQTDDRAAVQAVFNHLSLTTDSKPAAYAGPLRIVSGLGWQYAISGPICVGNVGSGAGMTYHGTIDDLKLVAIPGDWDGNLAAGISKQMLVVAWRMAEAYTDNGAGLFNLHFERITLDCGYLTGGIYFENTNSCSLQNSRIGRMGKGRIGYDTGQSRVQAGHPTGVYIGNGALLVENLNIGGLEEEADENFPPGEDQTTMNTIGLRHRTNDARLNNVIISRVSQAALFDDCGAVQVVNFHPWSRTVEIGPNTNNLMFASCYMDFTKLRIVGSFNHSFVGCHWILGNAAAGHGLELVATEANTTGQGLLLSGCRFRGDIGITYSAQGGAWAPEQQRRVSLVGCVFDTGAPAFSTVIPAPIALRGETMLAEVRETVHAMTSGLIDPGNGTVQTRALTAPQTLSGGTWDEGQTVVVVYTGANTHALTHPAAWVAEQGFPSTLAPVQEIIYSKVGGKIRYGAGRGWAS